jgi:hypothetical protein
MEEANVRQVVSRARKHIADGRRASVGSNEQRRFLEAFIAAAQKGDMTTLEGLFAEDVVSYSDGGGLVRAAGVPVSGRRRVAKFIAVHVLLEGCDACLGRNKRTGSRSRVA